MAIGDSYLTSVRRYMRLTTTAHDSELSDLINAARADLVLGGVDRSKAEFGLDNPDAEKYRASYKEQRNGLTLSDAYLKGDTGTQKKSRTASRSRR